MMTVKQFIRVMNRNANHFADSGKLDKAMACMQVSATLKQLGYDELKGSTDWIVEEVSQ